MRTGATLQSQRLWAHRPRLTWIPRPQQHLGAVGRVSLALIGLLVLAALVAPWISPYNPLGVDVSHELAAPSTAHLLGTDELGRDIFSRMLFGARTSLSLAAIVVVFAVGLGIIIGVTAGYAGGLVDQAIMRITDIFLAFPNLILAMAFSAALGPSIKNAALALGIVWWPSYARLVRAQALAIKQREYIEGARALGASPLHIVLRHVLPNSLDPILVRLTMTAGYAILAGASLSFVGLGAQPPAPEWGLMVATARDYFLTAWWYPTLIGFCILLTVLAFTVAGDAIQDAYNVRLKEL